MSLWSRFERRLGEIAGDLLPDETRLKLDEARALLRDSPEQAISLLHEIVESEPNHAIARTLLGSAQLESGQLDKARQSFDESLRLSNDLPEALLGRGTVELASKNSGAAEPWYQRAVEQAGGDRAVLAEAYRGLGIAHRRGGDLDKAVRELRKSVAEEPEDPWARAALGDALDARGLGASEEAQRHLRRASKSNDPPALAFLVLGEIALREGSGTEAAGFFERAIERAAHPHVLADPSEAGRGLLGAGQAALLVGDAAKAQELFLRATEQAIAPALVQTHLGRLHSQVGNHQAAIAAFRLALASEESIETLESALVAATAAGDDAAAVDFANQLLSRDREHNMALVARGNAYAREGQHEAAAGAYRSALEQGPNAEAQLGLAELARTEGDMEQVLAHARAALRLKPNDPQARNLLADSRAALFAVQEKVPAAEAADAAGLYQLARDFTHVFSQEQELGVLLAEAGSAAADFDRPLLVTVMGEFSTGKSSFVNAFVGAEVAPTGITPTTATINIVKYGASKSVRVVWQAGGAQEIAWDELATTFTEITASRATEISHVEFLLPLPALERVHIVDTPGLNSILPEHEEVARGFIKRADAVVWLFSANQAGKASEREALQEINSSGIRVLGVINKCDQLRANEVTELTTHIEKELGEYLDSVIGVSAMLATQGEVEKGNWNALLQSLESRFFSRSRELKSAQLVRRLQELHGRAKALVENVATRAETVQKSLEQAASNAREARDRFIDQVVDAERAALSEGVNSLYRIAAREVLALVRPRRLPFGSNQASPADRDYLIALLESGYDDILLASQTRVSAALESAKREALSALSVSEDLGDAADDVNRTVGDAQRWVEAQVFARTAAFLRGYLRGGVVAEFFRRDLPKAELSEDAIYQALYRSSPDLDREIALPLAEAGITALDTLADRLDHFAQSAGVSVFDAEVGIELALDELSARLGKLSS